MFTKVDETKSQKLDILAEFNTKQMANCIYLGATAYIFAKKNHVFLLLKIVFVLANSEGPDQMPHLGLYCLPKCGLRSQ